MAAWVCNGCWTVFSVDADCCPYCGERDAHEQGEEMAKNTVYGGPSIADVTPVVPSREEYDDARERIERGEDTPADALTMQDFEEHERRLALNPHAPAPEAPERSAMALDAAADEQEGGEDVSAGKSSSTSDEKPSSSSERTESGSRQPARTTESHSGQAPTGSSTARSTAGGKSGK